MTIKTINLHICSTGISFIRIYNIRDILIIISIYFSDYPIVSGLSCSICCKKMNFCEFWINTIVSNINRSLMLPCINI